jgi:hypothetical protein
VNDKLLHKTEMSVTVLLILGQKGAHLPHKAFNTFFFCKTHTYTHTSAPAVMLNYFIMTESNHYECSFESNHTKRNEVMIGIKDKGN